MGIRGRRLGSALVRVYLNMIVVPPSPATTALDATSRAGRLTDLSMRIQRHGRVDRDAVLAFAAFANLSEADLALWGLESLRSSGSVVVRRDPSGRLLEIEEQIGVAVGVLEQAAAMWEAFGPSDLERAIIACADQLMYAPLTQTDHRATLAAEGYADDLHARAFAVLGALGLLRRERSARLREDVLYSPYVWGSEAVAIAEFMHHLPANEREVAAELHRAVAERPGVSLETLGQSQPLLASARKVGLIHATRVVTTGGQERAFGFSPALDGHPGAAAGDIANDRKLFTAHILFGHRYGFPGTGRILDPVVLVRALLSRGTVGPASAISTDYPSLEARGIVAVEPVAGTRMANLRLVRRDVAEDSLRLLEQALGGGAAPSALSPRSIESLWVPGVRIVSPERDRAELPEIAPGAEAELMRSLVEELRERAARAVRLEDL